MESKERISTSEVPLSIVQTIEPRVNVGAQRAYAILQGAKEISPQRFPATSFSDTNINFDVNPPSSFIIVDRKVWITCPFLVTFTGPAPPSGNLLQIGVNDAPRSYPLTQCILSSRATINNTTVSINTNNIMQALLWYHNSYSTRREDYSGTPAMLDQSQNYASLVGAVRNPLGAYGDNTAEEARGAGLAPSQALLAQGVGTFYVVSNTPTSAQVLLQVQEPLFLPPFLFGPGDESGFYGVNKMSVYLQLGDLTRVWSHSSAGNPITTIAASITGAVTLAGGGLPAPQIQFIYLTPKPYPPLPSKVWYPYFELIDYVTTGASVAPLTPASMSSNSLFFPTIPRRLYVFLRMTNSQRTYQTTDTFAFITSVNVNWANRTGLLQSQNAQSLYNMAQQNGVEMSWEQWSTQVGSVLALDFGKNIGLGELEAAGVSGAGQYQFYITVNYINLNPTTAYQYDLYVVAVQEGTMLIEQNRAALATGVVSPADVAAAISAPLVPYQATERIYGGGNFWKDLKHGFSSAARSLVSHAPQILDAAVKYGPTAAKLLTGVGAQKRRHRRGGVLVGSGLPADALALYEIDSSRFD